MAGFRIEGNTSGNVAEVNVANALKVVTEVNATATTNVGCIRTFSENDPGTITGTAHLASPETSQDFRLRVGQDVILFQDQFNATAQNTGLWKHAFTTMTMTQSAGFLNVNAAGTSTTSGNYAALQSWRFMSLFASAPLCLEAVWQMDRQPIANETFQIGFGLLTAAADPIDGVWIELTSSGLVGVARFNSAVRTTVALEGAGLSPINTNRKYFIICGTREVEFWIDDVLYGTIPVPIIQGTPTLGVSLPVFIEKWNSGLVGASPNAIFKVSYVQVTLMDININKPWSEQLASFGLAHQGLNGGTMGGLATYPNSTNPTAATPTNVALTANLVGGLGGQGIATLWTLAATDMIVQQYLNPVGGVSQTPRTLHILGVRINAAAASTAWTAPTAGSYLFQWGLAFGAISTSFAATESASFVTATSKIARRKVLGLMGQTNGTAGVGTQCSNGIDVAFQVPIVVNPGEYVNTFVKIIQGSATPTGGLYYVIDFDYYFE